MRPSTLRCKPHPVRSEHLILPSLLDRDPLSAFKLRVDGRRGGHHVEGDPVAVGEHCQGVGADLVGGVAVPRDAIRPNEHCINFPFSHEPAGGGVGDQPKGDPLPEELPGGEPRPLQARPGLAGINQLQFPLLPRCSNYPKGGAVAAGRQRSCVANREDTHPLRKKFLPVLPDPAVGRDILLVNPFCFFEQRLLEAWKAFRPMFLKDLPHPPDGPEQVHRGGASPGKALRGGPEKGFRISIRREVPNRKDKPVSSGDPDGRRAPHPHGPDGLRHLLPAGKRKPHFLMGKARLVQEPYRPVLPVNRS